MNAAMQLISVQYALALLIGQDLTLQGMLRKFLPSALKLLHCRSGYLWLYSQLPTQPIDEPTYCYPQLTPFKHYCAVISGTYYHT